MWPEQGYTAMPARRDTSAVWIAVSKYLHCVRVWVCTNVPKLTRDGTQGLEHTKHTSGIACPFWVVLIKALPSLCGCFLQFGKNREWTAYVPLNGVHLSPVALWLMSLTLNREKVQLLQHVFLKIFFKIPKHKNNWSYDPRSSSAIQTLQPHCSVKNPPLCAWNVWKYIYF